MKKMWIVQLAMCVLFVSFANAQKATSTLLRGKIIDTEGQSLPGATIVLLEFGTGSVTDVDGNYILPRIPAGTQKIKYSYIGYADTVILVHIKEGVTNEQNVELSPTITNLSQVEVLESFQSYQRAMNYQKNSKNLRNIVSSNQAGRFPDANIGDALKRISGVNVQYDQGEARFGQIRGTSPEFSAVTVNGNKIPSAEGDVRNVQLDLVPADMVQTIVVNKVVTADMDGDAIGGSVDLITKNSPTREIFSASIGSGWNIVSQRPQWSGALTYGTNIGKQFGFILSASYQNNPIGSDNTEFEWTTDEDGNNYVEDYQVRKYLVHRERQSYSLSAGYKFNPNHKIDFKGIYNRRNDWENRFRFRLKDISEDGVAEKVVYQTKGGAENVRDARLERQETMDYALNGEHLIKSNLFDWNFSYAQASEKRPNERYMAYERKDVAFNADYSDIRQPILNAVNAQDIELGDAYELDELTEKQQAIKEKDLKARVNLNIPLLVGARTGSLKIGAKYVHKDKERELDFYDYKPTEEANFNQNIFSHLKSAVDGDYLAGNYQVGKFVSEKTLGGLDLNHPDLFTKERNLTELGEIYNATEQVISAYVRYDQQIGDKLSLVAGLRAEATYLENQGVKLIVPEEGDITLADGKKNKDDYVDFLPSVLFRYDLNDNAILRTSFTRTLARPNYFDLVSYVSIHGEDNKVSLGNSELTPTYSNNVDFSIEYYYPQFGQISLGGYYKSITDLIVKQVWQDKEYQGEVYDLIKQPTNGGNATLFGLEASWQRDLSFIAPCLRHMGIYTNYTYTYSRMKDSNIEREYKNNTEQAKDEKLRMPGSPEHIANASLYYENKGLNLRVSYNIASSFVDQFGSSPETDRFYDQVNYLDANASYTFAKHYTIFADATNLLNQPLRYYQGSSEYTAQSEYYGPRFNFGVKVAF